MDSPLKSPNGSAPVRITLVKDAGHGGRITRVASWLAYVPIAKLVADHLTAPLRARAPPTTARSGPPVGSSAARSTEARQIATCPSDEQHSRVARERHSTPSHSR